MLRVLITDSSRPVAERVAKQLSGDFLVEICCDGRSVLRKFRSFEPDIVLLDMMLPLLDGASILHTLRTSGFTGKIVIVSANQDLFTCALMEKYGISYGFIKPYVSENAVSCIHQLAVDLLSFADWDVETEIDHTLLRLGFQMGRSRYECTFAAILLRYNGEEGDISNCLYAEVRKMCGKRKKEAVEKAIRDAIDHAWEHGDRVVWELYFEPRKDGKSPSNEVFIERIVRALKHRERMKKPCKPVFLAEKEA